MLGSAVWKKYAAATLIALMFLGVFLSQEELDYHFRKEGLAQPYGYVAGNVIGGIVLAGFKGFAVDVLWIIMDDTFHRGGWYKILPYFYTIGYLQPQFIHNWSLGAWHMSFNISHQTEDIKDKRAWILTGIDFDKKGIEYNRNRYELYFETGWIYYQKANVFDDIRHFHDEAIRYMRLATRFEHPDYIDRLIGHIYRKSGRLEQSVKEYERILEKKPEDHLARRNLDETLAMIRGEIPLYSVPHEEQMPSGTTLAPEHSHIH